MKIIPVIHVLNNNQVIKNVQTVIKCGLDAVFLINHNVSITELLNSAKKVKEQFPNIWVGVNLLGMDIENAVTYDLDYLDGLWCDQTMTLEAYKNRKFKGLLFTGYDFKYQPKPTENVDVISKWTDVIVTSGTGTGKETPREKLNNLVGNTTAVASGVNKYNINNYNTDYVLVASSITNWKEIIEEDKLLELIAAVKIKK